MSKIFPFLLVAAVLTIILPTFSHAVDNPVFGPKTYQRTTGNPNIYSDMVEACNTGAVYSLVVENGDGGANRVSSASIALNGAEIVKENDFSQAVERIEKQITLQSENSLNVRLSSGPGGFIKISIYCITNCLDVKITSPFDGSVINSAKALIKGSLYNGYGETGIRIKNSYSDTTALAHVQGSGFAGAIPLQLGANSITATAADACGYTAEDTVSVNAVTLVHAVRLTATPWSGILSSSTGAMSVVLEATTNLMNLVSGYSWDLDGDGTQDMTGKTLSKVVFAYGYAGLYFPSVTVTDTLGNTFTEDAVVNVLSRNDMDVLLISKWNGMKDGLSRGDIEKALKHFAGPSQKVYRYNFELMSSLLPAIAGEMGDITLVDITGDTAEYEMRAVQDGRALSFYVEFVRDEDGIWRIRFY